MLRFIHIADIHADGDPKKLEKLKNSFEELYAYCCTNKTEAIIIAGDIWDKRQSYNSDSAVLMVNFYLRLLSSVVGRIYIVKGNNAHDNEGSISLLHELTPNIYATEKPVCLAITGNDVVDVLRNSLPTFAKYIVSMVPYPTKAGIAESLSTNIDSANEEMAEMMKNVFSLIGSKTEAYRNIPHINVFHGNMSGAKISNGQTLVGQDLKFTPDILQLTGANYFALGHIHLSQEIRENMIYSGSFYNCNAGETDKKSFRVISFDENNNMTVERVFFESSNPMITLNLTFKDQTFRDDDGFDVTGMEIDKAEYVIKVSFHEHEKPSQEQLQKLEKLFARYSAGAVIKQIPIVVEREARSIGIMTTENLLEQTKMYAEATNQLITDGIIEKLGLIEEVAAKKK